MAITRSPAAEKQCMVRLRAPRLLMALAAGAAMSLVASAPAQATWRGPGPTQELHCGPYVSAPHAPPLWFQSCVMVHPSPSGAYVQGVLKVTNTRDDPRHSVSPTGYVRVWLDGYVHRNDNCGATVIAGGQARWCYGKTTWIPNHGSDVHATGYVWFGAGFHDGVNSAHWKTPRPRPTFPPAWSNGPVNALPWPTQKRHYSSITCGSGSIPATLRPESVTRGWTARTQAIAAVIRGPLFGWRSVGGGADGTRRGHISASYHYCGRAIDAFAPGVRQATRAAGAGLRASWRLANWAAHYAPSLNVSQVIFYDRIWTADRGGWRPYTNPGGSGNTRQHRDHVHISVY